MIEIFVPFFIPYYIQKLACIMKSISSFKCIEITICIFLAFYFILDKFSHIET